jgi:hypothetical protein
LGPVLDFAQIQARHGGEGGRQAVEVVGIWQAASQLRHARRQRGATNASLRHPIAEGELSKAVKRRRQRPAVEGGFENVEAGEGRQPRQGVRRQRAGREARAAQRLQLGLLEARRRQLANAAQFQGLQRGRRALQEGGQAGVAVARPFVPTLQAEPCKPRRAAAVALKSAKKGLTL